jgi:hypothetical protein
MRDVDVNLKTYQRPAAKYKWDWYRVFVVVVLSTSRTAES